MSRTLVIAEPGGTAEGDYGAMVRLLETAHACGADVWKPQWVSSAEAHLQRRTRNLPLADRLAFYDRYATAYKWLQFPIAWHRDFADRCHDLGMEYAVSVCLPLDVWMIESYVDRYKISSFEHKDDALVRTARATGKPVYVSAGMCEGNDPHDMWGSDWLHCVSSYPAPLEQANLSAIQRNSFGGYSDHTRHVIAGSQAVAYGAKIVEAHYRLDDCHPLNPDYAVAFSPAEFMQYIGYIRDAERMRGDGRKVVQPCEAAMLRYKVKA